jgi:uncharacterized protein (DUF58 family)
MKRAAEVALCGIVLTLAAFLFDASPLFVPGIAFTLLGVVTPLWVWASAQSATVERRLVADRVVEGEPVEAMIEVSRGPLGLPGGEVIDPLAGAPVSLSRPLSLIVGGRKAHVRVVARFSRRGLHRLEPPLLIVRDMLELASTMRVGAGAPHELLILPRTEAVRWATGGRGARSESSDSFSANESLAAVDIDGLRPYREGTSASRIHWPALARGAGLLERRLLPDSDTRPLVVLDARGAGALEHLDAAVRAAASLTLELARLGGCRLLLPGERRAVMVEADLSSWSSVHARLALVEGGDTAPAPALVAARSLGPLFYVAAQLLERLPAALAGAGGGPCVLVLPVQLRHRPPVGASFEVTGCRGYVLGARSIRPRERTAVG